MIHSWNSGINNIAISAASMLSCFFAWKWFSGIDNTAAAKQLPARHRHAPYKNSLKCEISFPKTEAHPTRACSDVFERLSQVSFVFFLRLMAPIRRINRPRSAFYHAKVAVVIMLVAHIATCFPAVLCVSSGRILLSEASQVAATQATISFQTSSSL